MSTNNVAKSTKFIFRLMGQKEITLRIQSVGLGAVDFGGTPIESHWGQLMFASNKADFGPMTVNVLCSEDFTEWVQCLEWAFDNTRTNDAHLSQSTTGVLLVHDMNNIPVLEISHTGMLPINVGGVDYSYVEDERTLTFPFTLSFDTLKITNMKTGKVIEYGE